MHRPLFLLGLCGIFSCLAFESAENPQNMNSLDLAANADGVDLKLECTADSPSFYPHQRQAIWPTVDVCTKDAECQTDKVILESSDLASVNLAITEVYAYCPGSKPGDAKIHCEWPNASHGFHKWSKITLERTDEQAEGNISVNLTLSVYRNGKLADSKSMSLHWQKRAPSVYKQVDISKFPQPRAIHVPALPATDDELLRLKQCFNWADFQPTGFYLNPSSNLTVTVSGIDENGPKPQIIIGTPELVHPIFEQEVLPTQLKASAPLQNGHNMISDPYGGILYIRYTHTASQKTRPPVTVLLEGDAVQPFPLFKEGLTTDDQWKAMLEATTVPFAEHFGHRIILTGLAKSAQVFVKQGQKQQPVLDWYKKINDAEDRISGLDASAPNARDRPSPLRPMVVQSKTNMNPHATNFRAAIPSDLTQWIWSEPVLRGSWGIYHELGHHRQHVRTWSWGSLTEVTVNIYSLAAKRLVPQEHFDHGTPSDWAEAKKYLAQPASAKDFESHDVDLFVKLAMFEQLRVAFGGDAFYHQLHKISRAGPEQKTDADKKHYFVTLASRIAKKNLTDYFQKWGFKLEQRSIDEMKKQPNPSKDYTTTPIYQSNEAERDDL